MSNSYIASPSNVAQALRLRGLSLPRDVSEPAQNYRASRSIWSAAACELRCSAIHPEIRRCRIEGPPLSPKRNVRQKTT